MKNKRNAEKALTGRFRDCLAVVTQKPPQSSVRHHNPPSAYMLPVAPKMPLQKILLNFTIVNPVKESHEKNDKITVFPSSLHVFVYHGAGLIVNE